MRCRAGQNVKISAALIYRSHLLENLPWVEHGFGTRLTNGWPDASRLISLKQIHSDWVITARNFAPNPANAQLGEGDALITQAPGVLVSVRTADCIPILIADAVTHAVAAVHAGWRGTVKEVGRKTLETMSGQFGTQPLDVLVAIGPGIGGCCYEVGPEVAAEFGRFFPERTDLDRRTRIDLAEANRRQFETLGIPPTHIEVLGMCTSCCAGEFHSYRRDGKRAGRMVSAIGIRNGGK